MMDLRKLSISGISFLFLASAINIFAEIKTIQLAPNAEISAAEIMVWNPPNPGRPSPGRNREGNSPSGERGALVLCPGQNGSSAALLKERVWQEFAEREKLVLVGMRFVSSDEDLKEGRGYFAASRGSGALLEEGLKKAGLDGIPLLLSGFSGGAHFVMSFAAWRPDRVAAFCAYSFAWWEPPPETLLCPALIVCGQADGERYGSSLGYFQEGRRQGKPWAWMSLKDTPHAPSAELDDFVRDYFASVLREEEGQALVRVDNMTEHVVDERGKETVSTSILPCLDLLSKWQEIHYP